MIILEWEEVSPYQQAFKCISIPEKCFFSSNIYNINIIYSASFSGWYNDNAITNRVLLCLNDDPDGFWLTCNNEIAEQIKEVIEEYNNAEEST